MQPSTRARRVGEYATVLDLTTENSNMDPSPLEPGLRRAAVPVEPQPGQPTAMTWPPPSQTEMRNDRTTEIDTVGTLDMLRLLNAEDALVAEAVAAVLPTLAEVVDRAVAQVREGGHVHYFGAGSSGRIGVLDAAEVVPTFGVDAGLFVAHHAGGESAAH